MAYMYIICRKSDMTEGYIGQARGETDALDRIYQHIAGSYHIPYKVKSAWKDDRYQDQNESSKFLLDSISTVGACNFQYFINGNSRTCYGVGAKSYNEFRKYWTFHKLGGRKGAASREDAEKLDFAEFVYIHKYRHQLGGSQRAGSQSQFFYLTEQLIKKIKKVQGKDKELDQTWKDLIKALEDIDEKVAWTSEKTADAEKILYNEDDLLYPESKVLGFAFEKSIINFIVSSEEVRSIIKQAAASPEMLKQFAEESKNELNKFFRNVKYSVKGIQTMEKSLTSVISTNMQKYVNENKSKWEKAFNLMGYGRCTINIPDIIIQKKAKDLKDAIKKIHVPTKEGSKEVRINWEFEKDSITVSLSNQPEPTWYSDAEDFLHGFNKDVTNAVRDVCVSNYKELYQDTTEGKENPADAFKALFQKTSFITDHWYMFFDPLMEALQRGERGPLVFENFKKDSNKWRFGRENMKDEFGNQIYFNDIIEEDEVIELLRNQNVIIW